MKPKKCALVSTPRSGTHYLRMSLDNHPKMRWTGEFFRKNTKPVLKSYERIKSYIYNGLCSTIIDQYDYVGFVWHLTLESDLDISKVDEFILLKRRNILEHLCSLLIATKTGRWRDAKSKEKIELNIAQLNFFIDRQNKAYKDFENLGVRYKTVFYEDLCSNFDNTMNSIQDYLGLEHFRIRPSRLKKQENRKVQEIISNYEEVKWTLKDMNLL
tara:strand:- start:207 stop:848 length:642 start_codon:yes stop_codon:yes gene_type:complete